MYRLVYFAMYRLVYFAMNVDWLWGLSDYVSNFGIALQELLILSEQIGSVERGLSEEIIARQMLTKTYLLPNKEGSASEEEEIDLCIICQVSNWSSLHSMYYLSPINWNTHVMWFHVSQDEYKNKEEIGILQCGHEYHADCVRRWLQEKNVCPLCKSKALSIG